MIQKGDIVYVCDAIDSNKRYYGAVASVNFMTVSVFWFFSKSIKSYIINNLSLHDLTSLLGWHKLC
jgi:hypothetical protein